jgi:hypothetical protein
VRGGQVEVVHRPKKCSCPVDGQIFGCAVIDFRNLPSKSYGPTVSRCVVISYGSHDSTSTGVLLAWFTTWVLALLAFRSRLPSGWYRALISVKLSVRTQRVAVPGGAVLQSDAGHHARRR